MGFEILVPSLLRQVKQFGVSFDFPGLPLLMQLNESKLDKFRPELIYSRHQTTFLHSLEALIDLIDFDKVEHHCTRFSGMLGSPASTAAYIMNRSDWDERAEQYLNQVVEASEKSAAPSAFPTSIFEISWVSISLSKL